MNRINRLLKEYNSFCKREYDTEKITIKELEKENMILGITYTDGLGENEDYSIQIEYDVLNEKEIQTIQNDRIKVISERPVSIDDMVDNLKYGDFNDFINDNIADYDVLDDFYHNLRPEDKLNKNYSIYDVFTGNKDNDYSTLTLFELDKTIDEVRYEDNIEELRRAINYYKENSSECPDYYTKDMMLEVIKEKVLLIEDSIIESDISEENRTLYYDFDRQELIVSSDVLDSNVELYKEKLSIEELTKRLYSNTDYNVLLNGNEEVDI